MCTLRYLAGGSYWDICFGFKVGFGSFFHDSKYGVIWPIMEALDKAYKIGLDAENREEMEKLAEEFAAIDPRSQSVFSGTVMAIDGWVMQTRKPYDDETTNVKSYRNRKGMWGLVVLAGCDARTRFTLWNVNNTGSNNDISAWNNSALKCGGGLPDLRCLNHGSM